MTADRLTEIRARVAAAKADRLLNGPLVTFDDIEFVLGVIANYEEVLWAYAHESHLSEALALREWLDGVLEMADE